MKSAPAAACRLESLVEVSTSTRRGVAFVTGHHDYFQLAELNELREKDIVAWRQLLARMDRWISRPDAPWEKEKFHGWNSSEFKGAYCNCFVFKYQQIRLYGFLCHPVSYPRYQLFVPVTMTTKKENKTDTTILDKTVILSRDSVVLEALKRYSPRQ